MAWEICPECSLNAAKQGVCLACSPPRGGDFVLLLILLIFVLA